MKRREGHFLWSELMGLGCPTSGRPLALIAYLHLAALVLGRTCVQANEPAASEKTWLAPSGLIISRDETKAFLVCSEARQVRAMGLPDLALLKRFDFKHPITGLALSGDATRFFVTEDGPSPEIEEVECDSGAITSRLSALSGACSPVLNAEESRLYVCYRFTHSVGVFDLRLKQEVRRIPVLREPLSLGLGLGGKRLVVANHLPAGAANLDYVAASVSVIEVESGAVLRHILLPNGATSLRGVAISPDGRIAAVTHNLARFGAPTTQVARGWMNVAALSLIDIESLRLIDTVYLDDPDNGAANPWAVAWSGHGRQLLVSHAGSHELSVIDMPSLMEKLAAVPRENRFEPFKLLRGIRQRIALPDKGPRAIAWLGSNALAAGYFSDTLSLVDIPQKRVATNVHLSPPGSMSESRRGEMLFNDATLCYQQWQSCASCHPDGRADALNWDLLNDGVGNPKNTRSLLLAHQTPPSMSVGLRESAAMAVRSGLRHILFAVRPEAEAAAIDVFLSSMKPQPSPWLVHGELSDSAQRGRLLFLDPQVDCKACHPPGLFTNLQAFDVGTAAKTDKPDEKFDTPTLIECWRTAPYLHDGSARSIQEVLTTCNAANRHGKTRHLNESQLNDLSAYVTSL